MVREGSACHITRATGRLGMGRMGLTQWISAAMTAIMKAMGENENGCSLFMEDYTYNLEPGKEYSLGAHMLEVCPCCAAGKPRIERTGTGRALKTLRWCPFQCGRTRCPS